MSADAQRASDADGAVKAPLFASLFERLHAAGRQVVLDLGPARRAALERFAGMRCRLEIIDLPSLLPSPPEDADDAADAAAAWAASAMLPPGDEALDAVLAWDLPNHLGPRALSALTAALATRAKPGALMHALIVYSSRTMHEQATPWDPVAEDRLLHQPGTGALRDAPRYTPDDLARLMPDWRVERAMLLRSGMQEFLFRR